LLEEIRLPKQKHQPAFFIFISQKPKILLVIDKLDHIWIQLYTSPLERFSPTI